MELKTISSQVTVTPQITADDLAAIKELGFRAIICNRPDGEGADQPNYEEIDAAARAVGIEARYVPVRAGMARDEDVAAFAAALDDLPGPVVAYCRTGTRSAMLWALSEAARTSTDDILVAARAAGYDLTSIENRLAERIVAKAG